jgi:hypothetical protein
MIETANLVRGVGEMKKHATTTLLVMLIIVALLLAALFTKAGLTEKPPTTTSGTTVADDPPQLKDKAKLAGHFVGYENPNKTRRFANLEELAAQSAAVIIATAGENVCRLSPDGRSITIDYPLSVQYLYKGNLHEGDSLSVSLPGGKVVFADGTTAEIRTPWFKKMQRGVTYLLFLTPGDRSGNYVTTGGAQGLFEIPTDPRNRKVKTHTGLLKDAIWKYQDMDVKDFLRAVRRATKKG